MEGARICKQSRIDAFSYLLVDRHAKSFAQIIDHLSDRRGGRIDPVDLAEERCCAMVIDVDDKLLVEVYEAWTVDIAAFDDESCVIAIWHCRDLVDLFCTRQFSIGVR